jgi:hypothetical protein
MGAEESVLGRENETKLVRPTEEGVRVRLAEAGMIVPEECVAGTVSNMIVLQDHAAILRTFPIEDHQRSALGFRV